MRATAAEVVGKHELALRHQLACDTTLLHFACRGHTGYHTQLQPMLIPTSLRSTYSEAA